MDNISSRTRGSTSQGEQRQAVGGDTYHYNRRMDRDELFALYTAEEEHFASIDGDRPPSRQEGVAPTNQPVDDRLGGGPLRPPALHEDVAWAIAMAFYEQLHTHVALEIDPLADAFDMVKSYEWVTFNVNDPSRASIAQAATTTWFWLSCCPGYSGCENPRFWKRVFCELRCPFPQTVTQIVEERIREEFMRRGMRLSMPPIPHDGPILNMGHYTTPIQKDNSITDAIRFFDHPDRPFPRVNFKSTARFERREQVRLATKWKQRFSGFSWQLRGAKSQPERKLQEIWLQLEPFIARDRLLRPIDVRITGELSRTEVDELIAPHPLGGGGELMVLPQFVLLSPVVTAHMDGLNALQKQLQSKKVVTMPKIQFTFNANDSVSDKADRLRTLFCVDPNHSDSMRGQIHRVGPSATTASEFEAICSVLPHSQSIHTLTSSRPHHVRALGVLDWAWLGYALFHPDTQVSKWCNLDICVGDLTVQAVRVLGLMSRGNNLVQVLEGTHTDPMLMTGTTTSFFYHSAHVHEGTHVHAEPIGASEIVLTLHGFTHVCLCVDDPSALDPWVRVVAPGVGFGWIKSSSIAEIVSRPPGKSCLQSLRLHLARRSRDMAVPEILAGFLSLLGGNVTRLELEGSELDATTLRAILTECPALTALRVKHDGSLWANPDVEQLPSLQRLWLTVDGDFQAPTSTALASCLRDLTQLRISAPEDGRRSQQTKQQVVKLLERHPAVQYLHVSDGDCLAANRRKQHGMFPYVRGRLRTNAFFSELSPHALSGSCAPFSTACQLAFLSVIKRKSQLLPLQEDDGSTSPRSLALGRLDRDVASQIFAFASSLAPRDLWFGGD